MADHLDTMLECLGEPPAGRATGPIAMLNAAALPGDALRERATLEQGFRPGFLDCEAAGYKTVPTIETGPFDAVLIALPRSRALAEATIARGWNMTAPGGRLVVAGPVKSSIKALRKWVAAKAPLADSVSRHHAVAFAVERQGADWPVADLARETEGYATTAGSFSAERVDAGSRLLLRHLTADMRGCVADLGGGWGYLSRELLKIAPEVGSLALYEADHAACEDARRNLSAFPQAEVRWADVTRELGKETFNHVVMNPPFHTDRAADPNLGRAFIAAAHRALGPGGVLWMVANRTLPYETTLQDAFAKVERLADEGGFKVMRAMKGRR
ncbi:class I SAM-dependent methyltransferase [Rhizobiaceae bacterium]|nr:class I SAM-dependent methyltransferase [Rhizobiaceae bacterium]